MATASFTKVFVISDDETAKRLEKVLSEKDEGKTEVYPKINVNKSLAKGLSLSKQYFSHLKNS